MKSNLNWKTEYFIRVNGCIVGIVYNTEHPEHKWSAYIKASNVKSFSSIFDELTKANIKCFKSDSQELVIDLLIDFEDEDTFIGGYLPNKYEELLEQLETVVYELTRDEQGEENG